MKKRYMSALYIYKKNIILYQVLSVPYRKIRAFVSNTAYIYNIIPTWKKTLPSTALLPPQKTHVTPSW